MQDVARLIEQSEDGLRTARREWRRIFPGMGQAYNDARFNLLTGKFTPEQYGDFLEEAATKERLRAQVPDGVAYRHIFGGSVLLVLMAAAVFYTIYSAVPWLARRRLAATDHRTGDADEVADSITVRSAPRSGCIYFSASNPASNHSVGH